MKGKTILGFVSLVWVVALTLYVLTIGPAVANYTGTNLGGLGSPSNFGIATSLNEKGQVVGLALDENGDMKPFIWLPEADYDLEAEVMHSLGSNGAFSMESGFPAINESGQVVWTGEVPNTVTTTPTSVVRGYIWLPESDGVLEAGAHEMDVAAGNAYPDGATPTYVNVRVLGINDAGLVIGNCEYHYTSETPGDHYYLGGYVWEKGTATAIPTVDDPTTTAVEHYYVRLIGMSPSGKMIGTVHLLSGHDAVVTCEKGTSGITAGLLIEPHINQTIDMSPLAINDQGEIVLKASSDDLYIWLPTDTGDATAGLYAMDFSAYPGLYNIDIAGIGSASTGHTGQVLGALTRDVDGTYESVVWAWQDGEITDSYTAPEGTFIGYLYGPWMWMNNSGQMVAARMTAIPDPENPGQYIQQDDAVVWNVGAPDVEVLPSAEGMQGIPFAINDAGQSAGVVANMSTGEGYACLWSPTSQPPTLDVSAAPSTGIAGTTLTFTADASDPEGGAVTFGLENAPTGASINSTTGVFTWKPTSEGSVTFKVTASDADGETTRKSVTIQVLPALIFGVPTAVKNGRTISVTVRITNRSASNAANVIVNAAELNGIPSNSPLPLLYGTIKAGVSKQCKLQFKNVPSGADDLWVHGTCSLGNFYTLQTVNVP